MEYTRHETDRPMGSDGQIERAAFEGQQVWALEIGPGHDAIVLFGTRQECIHDILDWYRLDELPGHWTLEELT